MLYFSFFYKILQIEAIKQEKEFQNLLKVLDLFAKGSFYNILFQFQWCFVCLLISLNITRGTDDFPGGKQNRDVEEAEG